MICIFPHCIVMWISICLFGVKTLIIWQFLQWCLIDGSNREINKQSVLFSKKLPRSIKLVLVVSPHHGSCLWWLSLIHFQTHTHTNTDTCMLRSAHICTPTPATPSTFAHLHTFAHMNTLVLFFPLSFLKHNFQLNFQQKCATLSPSAGVVTLSYSGTQSSTFRTRLVIESLSRDPCCYITYTHFTGLPYQWKASLCECTEVEVGIKLFDVL